jgi:predicted transcriptional regulator
MNSYQKWDRAAYVERVGGLEAAEQRRKGLMARQSGHRLAEERKHHGLTQAQLAGAMGVTPGRVSQVERGEVATIEVIARYIEALGGRLDLIASFGDHTLTISATEAA